MTGLPKVAAAAAALLSGSAGAIQAQVPERFPEAWAGATALFHELAGDQGVVGASLWFLRDGEVLGRELPPSGSSTPMAIRGPPGPS